MKRIKAVVVLIGACVASVGFIPMVGADDLVAIPACRLLDTRSGSPIAANTATTVDVRGECLIPENATGVIFNLTVVSPAGSGYLKAYGTVTAPDTAVITYNSGETVVTTGATVWLSTDDENTNNYDPPSWGLKLLSLQQTHVVIDVTGYVTSLPTTYFSGKVTAKEDGNGPPWVALGLDTLPIPLSLICQEPWIDPDHCDFFNVNDEVCGIGHIATFGFTPEIFVHTMTDCQ